MYAMHVNTVNSVMLICSVCKVQLRVPQLSCHHRGGKNQPPTQKPTPAAMSFSL